MMEVGDENTWFTECLHRSNLHLSVAGTTSTAGRFVALAILALQISVYS